MPSLNLSSIFLLKICTQNYDSTSLRKSGDSDGGGGGGGRLVGLPNNFVKLPGNLLTCIEKTFPNNFPQVTTILSNLYHKYYQLIN